MGKEEDVFGVGVMEAPRPVEEDLRVCGLCWDWILEGQAVLETVEEGLVHRACRGMVEGY